MIHRAAQPSSPAIKRPFSMALLEIARADPPTTSYQSDSFEVAVKQKTLFNRFVLPRKNPIHRLLDESGAPWRVSRSELAERFGVRSDPAYFWDVVEIETERPIVPSLIKPLSTQAFPQFSPFVPATYFSAHAWSGDDARSNLNLVERALTASLGRPRVADTSNSLGRVWAFERARVSITVWPFDIQGSPISNPAHNRDPRLRNACSICIETGYRSPLTMQEAAWLDRFHHVGELESDRLYCSLDSRAILMTPACQNEMEFVREPPKTYRRVYALVGYPPNREALIFCHSQLYIIPIEHVLGFRLRRLKPARFSGGSFLEVECATGYEAAPTKYLSITSGEGPHDLDDLTGVLAETSGKQAAIEDCDDDR